MDIATQLREQVHTALAQQQPLQITGGASKSFYGREPSGEVLHVAGHTGIVDYDFRELVITARAGTSLTELNAALAENNQCLPFEPPVFAETATLGGTLACGFSGPARPYAGSARDYVLGSQVLNGKAEMLTLGGQVMKNVAGYDLSRLMVGALGTLGVILQASLKVLPKPAVVQTTVLQLPVAQAIEQMNRLAGSNMPLSAAVWLDGKLYLRFSGFESSVSKALAQTGGEIIADDTQLWLSVREQTHTFFNSDQPLWRLSLPASTPELSLKGKTLYDWGGAQRWFLADTQQDVQPAAIFEAAALAGGHATLFRRGDRHGPRFQPLPPAMMAIHKRIKHSLDADGIFNPGRMYQDI